MLWLSKNLTGNTTLYKNEEICPKERAQEVLLTGLRLTKGIKIKELFNNASISTLDRFINMTNLSELQKLGLINRNTSTLRITSKGFPVLNTVINKLLI